MRLAIIGDYNDNFRPRKATIEVLGHSLGKLKIPLSYDWVTTDTIDHDLIILFQLTVVFR